MLANSPSALDYGVSFYPACLHPVSIRHIFLLLSQWPTTRNQEKILCAGLRRPRSVARNVSQQCSVFVRIDDIWPRHDDDDRLQHVEDVDCLAVGREHVRKFSIDERSLIRRATA